MPQELFHYLASVEQLQALSADDIIPPVTLRYLGETYCNKGELTTRLHVFFNFQTDQWEVWRKI